MDRLQLRESILQHKPKNVESKNMEEKIKESNVLLLKRLRSNYPNYKFNNTKIHYLREIGTTETDTSFLKPDGGFICFQYDGIEHIIGISEAKRQGTNDKRLKEGLRKQSKGNAVERSGKNYNLIQEMFRDESILPYAIFLEGCDFNKGSTIRDRVGAIFRLIESDKINLYKDIYGRAGSYFYANDGESWTSEEIMDIMYNICIKSIKYYESRYIFLI